MICVPFCEISSYNRFRVCCVLFKCTIGWGFSSAYATLSEIKSEITFVIVGFAAAAAAAGMKAHYTLE